MARRDSELDRLTCRFGGRSAIALAAGAAHRFGEAQRLSESDLARLCIVIEELVSNLYDHGGMAEADEVELTLVSEPDGIGVVLVDTGVPFDPWQAPMPTETPDRGGGAGIGLVRAWAQFVDYRTTDRGNRLELLLPLRW
jgi:serine/threonine-protein kinase RsbW